MEMAIEADSVGRLFGSGADAVGLRELDLAVPPGSVVALLGHNGAGKTTAVRGLATLLEFDRGQARVAGFSVRSQPQEVRQRISLVGQMAAVDEHLSATDNLVLFGRLRGLNRTQASTRAVDLLDQFGLAEARGRPVRGFSGGMRRRLDVAASIITRPEVLFDSHEPSSRSSVFLVGIILATVNLEWAAVITSTGNNLCEPFSRRILRGGNHRPHCAASPAPTPRRPAATSPSTAARPATAVALRTMAARSTALDWHSRIVRTLTLDTMRHATTFAGT